MELDELFASADFFGMFRQDHSDSRKIISRFFMNIKTRNLLSDCEKIQGTGTDCLGEFSFDMQRTPTTIMFQKKYCKKDIQERGAFAEVIDYELQRLSENYFAGYWVLFDSQLQGKINGPACMVDLNEAKNLGRENLEREIVEFCDAVKFAEAVRNGSIELNQRN